MSVVVWEGSGLQVVDYRTGPGVFRYDGKLEQHVEPLLALSQIDSVHQAQPESDFTPPLTVRQFCLVDTLSVTILETIAVGYELPDSLLKGLPIRDVPHERREFTVRQLHFVEEFGAAAYYQWDDKAKSLCLPRTTTPDSTAELGQVPIVWHRLRLLADDGKTRLTLGPWYEAEAP